MRQRKPCVSAQPAWAALHHIAKAKAKICIALQQRSGYSQQLAGGSSSAWRKLIYPWRKRETAGSESGEMRESSAWRHEAKKAASGENGETAAIWRRISGI